MTGGSDGVAGIDNLTIGQLEARLQLAMAVNQHLTEQQAVSRHDMRVALESLGLDPPAEAPLNSFTEQPSRTNFSVALAFVRSKETELSDKLLYASRRQLTETLEQIANHIQAVKEPWEPRYLMLQVVSKYLDEYEIPGNHVDEVVQKELTAVHSYMSEWEKQKQLGQDVIENATLYQKALELWEPVSRVIASTFYVESYDDQVAILQAINNFCAAARQAEAIEQEQLWSPNELVAKTVAFMASFNGPIPYKLQSPTSGVHQLLRDVDKLEDQRLLTDSLQLALAVRDYLGWCWRLDAARTVAVDLSISISRCAGHLRAMTA